MMTIPCPVEPSLDFFGRKYAPYYIPALPFTHKFAGIRALHHLCHALNELGCEAYMWPEGDAPGLRTPQLTPKIRESHQANGCVPVAVYAETLSGNPFDEAVVARWLLNRAGHLSGHKDFSSGELLFYWDKWVLDGE